MVARVICVRDAAKARLVQTPVEPRDGPRASPSCPGAATLGGVYDVAKAEALTESAVRLRDGADVRHKQVLELRRTALHLRKRLADQRHAYAGSK
jgi:hypothetical protein